MSGFTSPNHTQTPNDLFDVHMQDMSEAELKVTLAIIRKTLGYHKKSDPISLTQLQKLTGLSRQGVSDGTAAAIKRGIVEVVGTGKRGVLIYGLVINSDQSTEETQTAFNRSEILYSTSQQSRHTKETSSKQKEEKKLSSKNSSEINAIQDCIQKEKFDWDKAYNQLEAQLDRGSFDTWVKGLEFLKYEAGVFHIGVSNLYARDMLQHRLYRDIRRILNNITGQADELLFEIRKPTPKDEGELPLFKQLAEVK